MSLIGFLCFAALFIGLWVTLVPMIGFTVAISLWGDEQHRENLRILGEEPSSFWRFAGRMMWDAVRLR